jgi:protein-disulfide isomerase
MVENNFDMRPKLLFISLLIIILASACQSEPSQQDPSGTSTEAIDGNEISDDESAPREDATSDILNDGDSENIEASSTPEDRPTLVEDTMSDTMYEGIEVGFTEDGHPYRGRPDAPVVMQEYSDYQCPFCARFYEQTLTSLLENQVATGDVVLIYYDFPLTNIHPQAPLAANAARCAGKQGADSFWAMHDLLFENVDQWAIPDSESVLLSFGEELGLEMDPFQDCVTNYEFEAEIDADLQSGSTLGISGTPSFVFNGQLLVGAQPLAVFNEAIETVKNGGRLAGNEPDTQPNQPQAAPTPAALLSDYAATMGDPDADVTIIEFTDYQCPYCSRHSVETLPSIVKELVETGRVFYAQKDLPLDQLHPNARIAASAARCAADQDAYWEMHDTLFVKQSEWANAGDSIIDIFESYASDIDLNQDSYIECLESGRHDAAVEANAAEARSLGVSGTPFFFVNGYPLNGARPYEHFELAVQYAEEGRLAEAYAPPPEQQQAQPSGRVDVPIGDAHSIGDPEAPITIVEYTDFQCPFCSRHFQQTYPQIIDEYVNEGLVRYVFKDFPLNNIHPQAAKAAEAARCAGDQDQYLEMHDYLFNMQSEWSGSEPTPIFISYAQDLDLDADAFSSCLTSGKYSSAVNADLQEGAQFGVTGTPAFFINGYPLAGAQPFEVFRQAIDSLLSDLRG